jgi:outer membrane receptor protein involved in Fe transport
MSKLGEFRAPGLTARALVFVFGALAFLFFAAGVSAQTAGKVEGTVTDRDTGQPLPGAQVLIDGTQLGNISDDNGYYFINNVPIGAQTVTASFLGYQTESQQHRILAGQTTTVDFALSTEVIVADSAIVTVTEREPLVPRDNTISKSRFLKENVQDLPLTSVEDLVTLAAGADAQQGGISLRGARPDDATVYVDGLNATDFGNVSSTGIGIRQAGGEKSPIEFGTFSIEQLDVVTGGADASYGDAQSGVINVVTGRGGADVSGNLRFTTDAMNIERSDDFYALQGNVGGPLLGGGKATFFLSGAIQGTRLSRDQFGFRPTFESIQEVGERFGLDISREQFCDETGSCVAVRPDLPLLSVETFVEDYLRANGFEDFVEENEFFNSAGDEDFMPGEFADRYSFAGKVAFTPSSTSDIQLSYTRNRDQFMNGSASSQVTGNPAGAQAPFNPYNSFLEKETVNFAIASWRQIFYQEAERSLAIDARVGYFDDHYKRGPIFDLIDQQNGFPLLEGNDGGDDFFNFRFSDYEVFFEDSIEALLESYEDAFDKDERNVYANLEAGLRQPVLIGAGIPDVTRSFEAGFGPDIFGVGAFGNNPGFPLPTVGFPRGYVREASFNNDNREKRLNIRADADMQLSRIDRLQGGVDLKFFDIHRFSMGQGDRLFNSIYFVEPRLYGFYATNRVDLGDFVLDLGGRFDYFDHNTLLPDVAGVANVDLDGDGDTVREYDTQTAFAPRLGVAHPVTDLTQVRFSYGVFNQLPGLDEIYLDITSSPTGNDINSNILVGNPELDFQQTRSFELGLTHLITEDVVADLVAYNRDIDKGTAARNVITTQAGSLRQLFNVNNGTVRGFDFTLTKRFSNFWSADVTYSYLDSKVTDSDQDAFTFNRGFDSTADNPIDAPATPLPADYDVTHKLASTFSLRFPVDFGGEDAAGLTTLLRNFGVFATARYNSGLPYTRQPINSAIFIEPPNASRTESTFTTDVRATKYFRLASDVELGAIFEIFNLFNNENLTTSQDIPFGESGVNNGVWNATGGRFLSGREVLRAEQRTTDPVVLADIDTSTPGGALGAEFGSFQDIDGDGIVSSQEQRIMGILAFGAAAELTADPKRTYRLGVELRF